MALLLASDHIDLIIALAGRIYVCIARLRDGFSFWPDARHVVRARAAGSERYYGTSSCAPRVGTGQVRTRPTLISIPRNTGRRLSSDPGHVYDALLVGRRLFTAGLLPHR